MAVLYGPESIPVQDSFNRPDESPATGLWVPRGSANPMAVVSNRLTGSVAGAWNYSVAPTLGADAPVGVFSTVVQTFNSVIIGFRAEGYTYAGYFIEVKSSSVVSVWRSDDADSWTKLGADLTPTYTAGDAWGLTYDGSTLTVWQSPGAAGTWNSIGTRTDSTFGNVGFFPMIGGWSTDQIHDDFGGGAVFDPTPDPQHRGPFRAGPYQGPLAGKPRVPVAHPHGDTDLTLYDAQVLADNPLVYWELGRPELGFVFDESPNGVDGKYVGVPMYPAAGLLTTEPSASAQFNGTTQYVESRDRVFPDSTAGDYTYEAWVYRNNRAAAHGIFGDPTPSNGVAIWLSSGADTLNVQNNGGTIASWTNCGIGIGKRRHLVVTRPSSGVFEAFIDGRSIGTRAGTTGFGSGNFLLRVGNCAASNRWNGRIQKAALYAGALGPARIAAHALAGGISFPDRPRIRKSSPFIGPYEPGLRPSYLVTNGRTGDGGGFNANPQQQGPLKSRPPAAWQGGPFVGPYAKGRRAPAGVYDTPPANLTLDTTDGIAWGVCNAYGWGEGDHAYQMGARWDRLVGDMATEDYAASVAGVLAADMVPLVLLEQRPWGSSAAYASAAAAIITTLKDVVYGATGLDPWYEILNEPYLAGTGGAGGNADPAGYAAVYKAAVIAGRAADPRAKFLCAGAPDVFTGSWQPWVDAMFAAVPDLDDYIDGWTFHPYGLTDGTAHDVGGGWQLIPYIRDAFLGQGSNKPCWITEVGLQATGSRDADPPEQTGTEQDQADRVTRYIADVRKWGYVRGFFWFCFHDYGGLNWGLVDSGSTERLAYAEYRNRVPRAPAGRSGATLALTAGSSTPADLGSLTAAAVSAGTVALAATTQVPVAASAAASSATLSLSAQTSVPLAASAAQSAATLGVAAPTQVPLAASAAQSSATLSLAQYVPLAASAAQSSASLTLVIPVTVPLAASAAQSAATLALTGPAVVSGTASGQSAATLALSAQTQIPAAASAGQSAATLSISAQTSVPLASSAAQSAATLALTATTQIPLAASAGQSSATATVIVPLNVPLQASAGQSSATLALTGPAVVSGTAAAQSAATLALSAQTQIALAASAGAASATLALKAQTAVPLAASAAQSSATLALTAATQIPLGSSAGLSAATLALTGPAVISGTSAGLSAAALALYAPTMVPLAASAAQSSAALALTGPAVIAGTSACQSAATLALTARPLFSLASGGQSAATLAMSAQTQLPLGAASGQSAASCAVIVGAAYISGTSSGQSSATLALTAVPNLAPAAAVAQSFASLALTAPALLGLAAGAQGGATLSITARALIAAVSAGQSGASLDLKVPAYVLLNPSDGALSGDLELVAATAAPLPALTGLTGLPRTVAQAGPGEGGYPRTQRILPGLTGKFRFRRGD